MRKLCVFGLVVAGFVAVQRAAAGDIDEGLKPVIKTAQPGEVISTLVFLNEQVNIDLLTAQLDREHATRQRRHEVVVRALQQVAATTQDVFLADMRRLEDAGRIERLHAYWISNVFRIDAAVEEIEGIAAHASVKTVYFNYEIELIKPVDSGEGNGVGDAVTNSLREIRAPEAWALGYDGTGILVSNMDTGVDGSHPALADRWAGVADPRYAGHPEWAWFDPFGGRHDFPRDSNGNGTHTMGTICGGAPGQEIGVAPGAIWMGSAPIDRGGGIPRTLADALLSFEWMLDPDGNPATNWDVPAVCSNSWGLTTGHGFPPCDELFWSHLDACEAAGIVILFSAGDEGASGLRRPADRATDDYRTCAVGAVDCEAFTFPWPIASFSSRGPTFCTPGGEQAIKPDLSAPGVNVYSAAIGGGYRRLSGTAMASPHVTGVVALIRQACPALTVPEVKQVLYDSAVDLGQPGEDNIYGWGNINAEAAVLLALDLCINSEGRIDLDRETYACEDRVNVIVRDIGLNLDPNTAEVVDITIESDSEPAGEIIRLTETGPNTSQFEGLAPISATNSVGTLQVADGDTIVATYIDENNGQGQRVEVTAEATVDCVPPEITNVHVSDVQPRSATIAFESNEPVFGIAFYGLACNSLNDSASGRGFSMTPTVEITGLQDNTTYFFTVEAEDEAGNRGADPICRSFTTPDVADFFTEQFRSGFDLEGLSLSFIPDGGADFYAGCGEAMSALPTDPVGGTVLPLTDDSFLEVTPPQSVSLYGTSYNSFFVGSNGYITFGAGDTDFVESLADHFDLPRISGAFDDLNPAAGGTVSWKDAGDRVAVTWENVPEYFNTGANTFQIEIFYADGTIRMSYLSMTLDDCIAGLSEGNGLDPDFFPSSLSEAVSCGVFDVGDLNCDGVIDAGDIEPFLVALFEPEEYANRYPNCDINLGDINGDGSVNARDIEGFLGLLFP